MKRFFCLGFFCLLCLLAQALPVRAATLSVTTITRAAADLTAIAVAADAAKSDKFLNTGLQFLYINNGGGSPITVTLTYGVGGTIDGQSLPNRTISVTNGHAVLVGPFPTNLYNDSSGYMNISYSAVTSVTVAPVLLGN